MSKDRVKIVCDGGYITAVFPDIKWTVYDDSITCFALNEGHGPCSRSMMHKKGATEEQSRKVLDCLVEKYGYDLAVMNRWAKVA